MSEVTHNINTPVPGSSHSTNRNLKETIGSNVAQNEGIELY